MLWRGRKDARGEGKERERTERKGEAKERGRVEKGEKRRKASQSYPQRVDPLRIMSAYAFVLRRSLQREARRLHEGPTRKASRGRRRDRELGELAVVGHRSDGLTELGSVLRRREAVEEVESRIESC